jgi:CheY-like chemotaxis protein
MPTRVLVVEDDFDLREVLLLGLEQEGYAVTGAENGLDGIVSLYLGARPDAVIVNLHMPVLSGADLVDVMRLDPRFAAVPVIVVSGAPVPPEVARSVDAVLPKPFDFDTLSAAIEDLVSRAPPPGAEGLHPTA